MGATRAGRASRFRAIRFASAGLSGVGFLALLWAAVPARADQPWAVPEGVNRADDPPPPTPVPPPPPIPAARRTSGSYLFFAPGGRTTYHPAADVPRRMPGPGRAHASYLFFQP